MTKWGSQSEAHTVPVALVSQLARVVQRWGIGANALLSPVDVSEELLEEPLARIPVITMCSLLEHARALTNEPGLGYHLGLQARAPLFGYLGFAGLSAATVGEALEMALQFAPLFSTALKMELTVDNRIASLSFEERADLGSVRDIVLVSTIVAVKELSRLSTGRDTGGSAELAFPEPAYHARFKHIAPITRFGQRQNRIRFDAQVLKFPIMTADPVALRLANEQCERALDELTSSMRLSNRVSDLLARDDGFFDSSNEVATHLGLSPRTLRRRLAAEGVSFLNLMERGRCEKAIRLLRYSPLPVAEIGRRVGYSGGSSFVRAFRRWTGASPHEHRRQWVHLCKEGPS